MIWNQGWRIAIEKPSCVFAFADPKKVLKTIYQRIRIEPKLRGDDMADVLL
jgi:hypothetical protein